MGVFCGKAYFQFDGEHGVSLEIDKGNVVIIPAGVAHKKLNSSDDFTVVGAYPNGADYNIKYRNLNEHPEADREIAVLKNLDSDPVYGIKGHLFECWYNRNCENV